MATSTSSFFIAYTAPANPECFFTSLISHSITPIEGYLGEPATTNVIPFFADMEGVNQGVDFYCGNRQNLIVDSVILTKPTWFTDTDLNAGTVDLVINTVGLTEAVIGSYTLNWDIKL